MQIIEKGDNEIMEAQPREIRIYQRDDGKIPFEEWLYSFRDVTARSKIKERLKRASFGNLGDYRSLGDGVFELRIDYGSGYRVYFGQIGSIIIIILCGGDKSTQDRDILKAKEYWEDYRRSDNG